MPADFDPRRAALQYAASVEAYADRARGTDDQVAMLTAGEALHALVCGLLYVGDQIREAHERPTALQLVLPNAEAVSAWRALEPEPGVRVTEPRSPLVGARVVGWDHGDGGVLLEVESGLTYRIGVGMPFEIPAKVTGFSPAPDEELVAALRQIRDHEEHMGSGPPDDEMREIARRALEVCDGGAGD